MPIYILLFIFVMFQLLDIYTTKRNLLDKDGKEHWPPMKYLINKFGFWRAIISSKVLAVIVVSAASLYIMNINSTFRRVCRWSMLVKKQGLIWIRLRSCG